MTKRFIFLAVALFAAMGAGAKNRVKEVERNIMAHLKSEGYVPSIDKDGDIAFKIEGTNFYVKLYDEGNTDERLYLEMFCLFSVPEGVRKVDVTEEINYVNTNYKMVRALWAEDDKGGITVCFEVPFFTSDGKDFNRFFTDYGASIASGVKAFFERLPHSEEEGVTDGAVAENGGAEAAAE